MQASGMSENVFLQFSFLLVFRFSQTFINISAKNWISYYHKMAALNIFQSVDYEHQMPPTEMNSEGICYCSSGLKMFMWSLKEEMQFFTLAEE